MSLGLSTLCPLDVRMKGILDVAAFGLTCLAKREPGLFPMAYQFDLSI